MGGLRTQTFAIIFSYNIRNTNMQPQK